MAKYLVSLVLVIFGAICSSKGSMHSKQSNNDCQPCFNFYMEACDGSVKYPIGNVVLQPDYMKRFSSCYCSSHSTIPNTPRNTIIGTSPPTPIHLTPRPQLPEKILTTIHSTPRPQLPEKILTTNRPTTQSTPYPRIYPMPQHSKESRILVTQHNQSLNISEEKPPNDTSDSDEISINSLFENSESGSEEDCISLERLEKLASNNCPLPLQLLGSRFKQAHSDSGKDRHSGHSRLSKHSENLNVQTEGHVGSHNSHQQKHSSNKHHQTQLLANPFSESVSDDQYLFNQIAAQEIPIQSHQPHSNGFEHSKYLHSPDQRDQLNKRLHG